MINKKHDKKKQKTKKNENSFYSFFLLLNEARFQNEKREEGKKMTNVPTLEMKVREIENEKEIRREDSDVDFNVCQCMCFIRIIALAINIDTFKFAVCAKSSTISIILSLRGCVRIFLSPSFLVHFSS